MQRFKVYAEVALHVGAVMLVSRYLAWESSTYQFAVVVTFLVSIRVNMIERTKSGSGQ